MAKNAIDDLSPEPGFDATEQAPAPKWRRKPPAEVPAEPAESPLLSPYSWRGVPGWRCNRCTDFYPQRDDAVMHALTHVPADKREEVMENLIKEGN